MWWSCLFFSRRLSGSKTIPVYSILPVCPCEPTARRGAPRSFCIGQFLSDNWWEKYLFSTGGVIQGGGDTIFYWKDSRIFFLDRAWMLLTAVVRFCLIPGMYVFNTAEKSRRAVVTITSRGVPRLKQCLIVCAAGAQLGARGREGVVWAAYYSREGIARACMWLCFRFLECLVSWCF